MDGGGGYAHPLKQFTGGGTSGHSRSVPGVRSADAAREQDKAVSAPSHAVPAQPVGPGRKSWTGEHAHPLRQSLGGGTSGSSYGIPGAGAHAVREQDEAVAFFGPKKAWPNFAPVEAMELDSSCALWASPVFAMARLGNHGTVCMPHRPVSKVLARMHLPDTATAFGMSSFSCSPSNSFSQTSW